MLSPLEDPRTPLEKIRRAKLYPILRDHGIQVSPSDPVTHMRDLVVRHNVDVYRKKPKPAAKRVEEMNMPELRSLAKTRGLLQTPRDKKTDLIRKLNGEDAAQRG